MTQEEAEAVAARLNAEHPDRLTHQWRAREGAEGWDVIKIGLPAKAAEELRAEQRADERPATADDPRPSYDCNVGGPWVGGG